MPNLLVLDPRIAPMLIDQTRLDSRRPRTFDVDRINIAGKFHFVGSGAEALERDLKNPRVRLRDADDMRIDYHVEVRRQSESLCVGFYLTLSIRHDREFVARRLERLQRLERARLHDAPKRGLAMYRAELRSAFAKFLFRNSRRRPPPAKKMFVRRRGCLAVPRAHQMSIDRRAPGVFRMLERERIELASFAREFARQQFVIQERERAAKVEQQRLQFLIFLRSHFRTSLSEYWVQGSAPATVSMPKEA